jgi:hypothetical protein
MSGLEVQRKLIDAGLSIPIIFISAHADVDMAVRAMKFGAVEFLTKPFRPQELVDAVQQALQRDAGMQRERRDISELQQRYKTLTAREREVMALFVSGMPFGRFALSTTTGTAIKQIEGVGLAQVRPFGRRGDLFAMAFNYSEASHGKHHESVFESFYRLRLTQSVKIGPDLEVSIHPTYATKAYTTTLLGARMEIVF